MAKKLLTVSLTGSGYLAKQVRRTV